MQKPSLIFGKFEAHTRNCFISLKVFRPGSNYFNEIDIFPVSLISGHSCRTIDNWDFFVLCFLILGSFRLNYEYEIEYEYEF